MKISPLPCGFTSRVGSGKLMGLWGNMWTTSHHLESPRGNEVGMKHQVHISFVKGKVLRKARPYEPEQPRGLSTGVNNVVHTAI